VTARRIVYWMRKVRVVPRSAAKYHTMRCAPFAEQVFSPKVPGVTRSSITVSKMMLNDAAEGAKTCASPSARNTMSEALSPSTQRVPSALLPIWMIDAPEPDRP